MDDAAIHRLAETCDLYRAEHPITDDQYRRLMAKIARTVAYRIDHPCRCGTVTLDDYRNICERCRPSSNAERYRRRKGNR